MYIGTVIEGPTRKDRKLKIKLDKDTTEKKYRLIKETDLQPYTFKNEKEVVCLNEKNCQYLIHQIRTRIYLLEYLSIPINTYFTSDPLNRL